MAYRFFDDTVTNASDTAMVTAALGDYLIFSRTAHYTAAGANSVVRVARGATISVDGLLYSGAKATIAAIGSGSVDLRVGSTGLVASAAGAAISATSGTTLSVTNRGELSGDSAVDSSAASTSLINAGSIDGRGVGVHTDGARSSINNSGSITGNGWGVQVTNGVNGQFVQNSGTILSSSNSAVWLQAAGEIKVVNTGTIAGRSGVTFLTFSASDAAEHSFTNHGTVSGTLAAFEGSEATDSVLNTGTIAGRVLLNGGNDTFATTHAVSARVDGGEGNDVLDGADDGRDLLAGGAGDDRLYGGAGNDLLMPGDGLDYVDGGDGRDILSYRDLNHSVAVGLATRFVGDVVVTLTSIEGLEGSDFNDYLLGDTANNWLYGRDGSDYLDGEDGSDIMVGGNGDDFYVVDVEPDIGPTGGDRVIESAGEGFDTVRFTSFRYTLPDNVEKAVCVGTSAQNAYGNAGANTLVGNAASNYLDGRGGNDVLTGGGGVDTFALTRSGAATLTDFGSDDKFELTRSSGFETLPAGSPLPASAFYVGSAAHDTDDRIIFNSTTHQIFYDPDGTGTQAQVLLATLQTNVVPTADQFTVF